MVGSQGLACMGTGGGLVGGEKLREWLIHSSEVVPKGKESSEG